MWVCKPVSITTGKLNPRAKEGCFIRYNDESKGYRVYWPGKNTVSVERNIYTDKKAVLNPGNIIVEGEWEQVEKPGISKSNIPSKTSEMNNEHPKENSPINSNTNPTDKPINPSVTDSNTKTQCNSLAGLPQYNEEEYGRGK